MRPEEPDRSKLSLSKSRIARKGLKDDFKLTQLRAIYFTRGVAADLEAAKKLQASLKKIYGIRLPVNPDKITITKATRGGILVGKKASLASGLITQADFTAAGINGVVIRGLDGRIAIASSREDNTDQAVEALLHIIRMRNGGSTLGSMMPSIPRPIIREFTLIDWPPFGSTYSPDEARTPNSDN